MPAPSPSSSLPSSSAGCGRRWKLRGIAVAIVLALAGIAILVPIVTGSFMSARLAGTQREAVTRTGHWAGALRMMDPGVSTALLRDGARRVSENRAVQGSRRRIRHVQLRARTR
jgi:hypothetical protein